MKKETKIQLQRMLLWFKSTLPKHELHEFAFHLEPTQVLILNEQPRVHYQKSLYAGILVGGGKCKHCNEPFCLKQIYDCIRIANPNDKAEVEKAIAEAKRQLQEYADQWYECWANVPEIPKRFCGTTTDKDAS